MAIIAIIRFFLSVISVAFLVANNVTFAHINYDLLGTFGSIISKNTHNGDKKHEKTPLSPGKMEE